jgi:hypothetical protein
MENLVVGRVVRDGSDLLLVLPDELVKRFKIAEGDDLVPISAESGKLTLELLRQAK